MYDNKDALQLEVKGNFKKECLRLGYPYNKLSYSYRKNKSLKDKDFLGWYAIKI